MSFRTQKGIPLPPNVFPIGELSEAYQWCLEFESAVDDLPLTDLPRRLREARVLGYMLREAPSIRGRKNVAKDVLACLDDSALSRLADFYISNLFLALRTAKAFSSSLFHFSSIPPFETEQDIRRWLLDETERGRSLTKAKVCLIRREIATDFHQKLNSQYKALFREGFRCVLTGRHDQESVDTIPFVCASFMEHADKRPPCATRVTHILPQYTNVIIPGGYNDYARNYNTMWSLLEDFACVLKSDDLRALRDVDKQDNVILLEENKYNLFNELKIWFEEDIGPDGKVIPNQYRIEAANPDTQLMDVQRLVAFNTPDAENFPLPNPRYLRIHAACARIALFSGVGKYVNDIFTGVEKQSTSWSAYDEPRIQ